jgi:AAA domain
MRLKSLKIEARGQNGWESLDLIFGQRTTLIFAPNGSGKTPIMQALASCLGFPSKFREDILEKCSSSTLVLDLDGKNLIIKRILTQKPKDFCASITFEGVTKEYLSEGEFSARFFQLLLLEPPALVSSNKQETRPYISTVLPLFYLNQSDGYTAAYKAPAAFIEDQFVEMVRFVFGLNPKHSYEVKKSLIEEKTALDSVNRKIVFLQKSLENQSRGLDVSSENNSALLQQADSLSKQLEELRTSVDASDASSLTLVGLVKNKEKQIRDVRVEIEDLQSRVLGIEAIRHEIEGEVETLGLNEEARRIFTSFHEICRNPSCGLFMGSHESYGKNLLYLRDQLKDLDRNASRAEVRIELLDSSLIKLYAEKDALARELHSPGGGDVDRLVLAVQALTRQLVDVENQRSLIEAIHSERSKLFSLEQERLRIQDRIESISSSGRSDIKFNQLRVRLRDLAVKWMDILETKNVHRNIEIDLDFRFRFNGEALDLFSGSTKSRLVLAIHAALFEEYISEPSNPFRFLILDTPKQQELHTSDLAKYLTKLEDLCMLNNAQLIVSSTEYDHPTQMCDARWLPTYHGFEHPMYLGNSSDKRYP